MNPYVIGGMGAAIAILGLLLKGAYEDKGELEAKLKTQAEQTTECADANETNTETITRLETRIATMVEERRVDTARREQVLAERERELNQARARAAELERARDDERESNAECADLLGMDLGSVCPATVDQLRVRTRGPGGQGNGDGD